MGLVSFLCGRRRRTETADLVVQVSVLSRETVVGLTVARARRMSLAEARGYIRARSPKPSLARRSCSCADTPS